MYFAHKTFTLFQKDNHKKVSNIYDKTPGNYKEDFAFTVEVVNKIYLQKLQS